MKNKHANLILKVSLILFAFLLGFYPLRAQNQHDKAIFKTYKEGYYEKFILSGIHEFENKEVVANPIKSFKVDMSSMDIPTSKDQFKTFWHNEPVSQGNTSTCWCFSTTSFFESEIYRLTARKIKLSEMYTVYYEFIEKAENYVEKRGNAAFEEGSESNAVTRIWKNHGIVPLNNYSGLMPGQVYHDHEKMFSEMSAFLKSVKASNNWNKDLVVSTIKDILNHYMGTPPETIQFEGKIYTPSQFLTSVLKFNPDDGVDVLSIMQQPYYQKVEYEVPDNWWHNKDYYNLPLNEYMDIIKKAISKGYTIAVGGDVSEAGFDARDYQTAIVPTFDIPSAYIDDAARQFRFTNKTTTDDHGMHIVGYMENKGVTWFLLKDSGAGSKSGGKENNKNFGYYFFHEDFVKLKMMDFMVHKDMVKMK